MRWAMPSSLATTPTPEGMPMPRLMRQSGPRLRAPRRAMSLRLSRGMAGWSRWGAAGAAELGRS